jgi:predicted negative regulator of RcsB-dependent stress response
MKGEHHAALTHAERVVEGDLSEEYAAEAPMVHALCLMNLGRVDDAQAPLALARSRLVRASSRKNLELLEARWHALAGDRARATEALHVALADPWTAQGGSGYLALGDAFAARGWLDEARTAWSKAIDDSESASAGTARTRLGATTH